MSTTYRRYLQVRRFFPLALALTTRKFLTANRPNHGPKMAAAISWTILKAPVLRLRSRCAPNPGWMPAARKKVQKKLAS